MSGYHDDILGPRGVLAVDAELLRKPFTLDDVARRIRHLLDGAEKTADIVPDGDAG